MVLMQRKELSYLLMPSLATALKSKAPGIRLGRDSRSCVSRRSETLQFAVAPVGKALGVLSLHVRRLFPRTASAIPSSTIEPMPSIKTTIVFASTDVSCAAFTSCATKGAAESAAADFVALRLSAAFTAAA